MPGGLRADTEWVQAVSFSCRDGRAGLRAALRLYGLPRGSFPLASNSASHPPPCCRRGGGRPPQGAAWGAAQPRNGGGGAAGQRDHGAEGGVRVWETLPGVSLQACTSTLPSVVRMVPIGSAWKVGHRWSADGYQAVVGLDIQHASRAWSGGATGIRRGRLTVCL